MKMQSPMLGWLSLCLLLFAPLGAQPPYQSPRVEPSAPLAGALVNLVQSPAWEPCGVPPPPAPLRYRIGPSAADDCGVRLFGRFGSAHRVRAGGRSVQRQRDSVGDSAA